MKWTAALGVLMIACSSDPDAGHGAIDGGAGSGGQAGGDAGHVPSDATADAAFDAAAAGDGAADAGPKRLPVFVGYGHGGRTVLSCDDGATWVANQYDKAEDDDFTHDATAARSLVFAEGQFVIAMGWGSPGVIRTSENGVEWSEVFGTDHGQSIWTVAAGASTLVLGEGKTTWRSSDRGVTWSLGGELDPAASHLMLGFGDHAGGRFVAAGDQVIHVSLDQGKTFAPATLPVDAAACLGMKRGPVYGGGVFLITSSSGAVCRSTDGGQSWSKAHIGYDDVGDPIWYDGAFRVYRYAKAFESTDGAQWSEVPSEGVTRFDSLAVSDTTKTLLALSGGTLYRSSDGKKFQKLPAESYQLGGASLQHLAFGWALPSAECPAD